MDDERQHIVESQRGDLSAFNPLVERYQGQVYNLALRMLGDSNLAADAAQETFISAYRAIHGFRGGNFRSWLLRIATNACLDLIRSAKAKRSISLETLELTPDSVPASKEESPESYVIRRELGQAIQKGLASLSHHHRLAVVLIDIQGFSYQEAAAIMGCSEGTVKSRLSRARGELREALQQYPELLPNQFRL